MDDADVWWERARHSWRVLVAQGVRGHGRFRRVREPGRYRRIAVWPLSQVLWASSVLHAVDNHSNVIGDVTGVAEHPDTMWNGLGWYARDGAYLDNRPRGRHYFDDNAWISLVAAQQAQLSAGEQWWRRAARGAGFLEGGCTPDGGVLWVRGGDTVNACSTGAAGLLFAVLAESPAPLEQAFRERMTQRAQDAAQFLHERLLRSDGLIADHVRADGSVEPSVWSYNQGLAVALFDRTGHRQWADDLENGVATGMPPEVLHRQPAAFTCIWYRTQMARRPTQQPVGLAQYLQQAWDEGRDARGRFTRVDRYDNGVWIDHAAITGLMAAYAGSPAVRAALL